MDSTSLRLNKYLATNLGISRREADILIEREKVKINGKIAEIGARVTETDQVECGGRTISRQKLIYLLFHKLVSRATSLRARSPARAWTFLIILDISSLVIGVSALLRR